MIKVGYFADGPWSHKAIEYITTSGLFEVVFIVPRFDTQDPVLKSWAEKLSVPFLPTKNVNSPEFINIINEFQADILVSMSFNQILKKEIIESTPKGFINCHAGALPFYRGRNPLNWAIINGESTFGITVHYVDEGIDTGDIIEQRHYPITIHDTYASLLDLAVVECAEVLISALRKISQNTVQRIEQKNIHPVGTYFGIRTIGDEIIDFNWSAERCFNFIRAISLPGPRARFFLNKEEYGIESAELIPNAPQYIATVGEVVGKADKGVIIKVGDSTLLLTKILNTQGQIITPKFKIGTRLNHGLI